MLTKHQMFFHIQRYAILYTALAGLVAILGVGGRASGERAPVLDGSSMVTLDVPALKGDVALVGVQVGVQPFNAWGVLLERLENGEGKVLVPGRLDRCLHACDAEPTEGFGLSRAVFDSAKRKRPAEGKAFHC